MPPALGRPPGVTPNTERIRELIKARGYHSVRAFARTRKSPRTLLNVVYNGQRASEAYMRRLARSLKAADVTEIIIAGPAEAGDEQPEAEAA